MNKYTFIIAGLLILSPVIASASFDASLKYGARGQAVVELQDLLTNENCLNVSSSGYFGLLTLKAVKCFQTKYNLPSTGFFGMMSRAKANEVVADITAPSNVAALAEASTTTSTTSNKPNIAKPKTFTLQNGTVIDEKGNIISTVLTNVNSTLIPQSPSTNNPSSLVVTLGQVTTTISSVHMEWDTNLPTDSKIFLTQNGSTQIIQSSSGRSTHHLIDASNLISGTQYSYTIEAIADNQSQKISGYFSTNNDNLVFSVTADKTSVMIGNNNAVNLSINVKYLTKNLNGLVVTVTASDATQNKTWTLGNYQSTTLSYQYVPKTTGQHTIIVTAGSNSQTFIVAVTSYVDIPATVSLMSSQNSSNFIQPPQTSTLIASLSCLYAGNTDWGHYVNPASFVYDVVSSDFTKNDLSLAIRNGNNPSCADIWLNSYPTKGGKFQLKITALKFGSNGAESDALGLPLTTSQFEVRDPNTIVMWSNNALGQGIIAQSPSSQIVNPYNQKINSAIVYIGGHSNATLDAIWSGSNPYNNLAYSYVPCDSSNSCNQEPVPTTTTSPNGGTFPIIFTSGYNYAKINILTPSTAINGTGGYVIPSDSVLGATLLLQ